MKRALYRCLGDEKRKGDFLSEVGHLTKLFAFFIPRSSILTEIASKCKGSQKAFIVLATQGRFV